MSGDNSTTVTNELSPEQKELYALEKQNLSNMTPTINNLISTGTSNLKNVYTPDYSSLASDYTNNYNSLSSLYSDLLSGNLPSSWENSKSTYYNKIYNNTLGSDLSKLAKSGVINSSRFNTTASDEQSNLAAQMSKDYTTDLSSLGTLANNYASLITQPITEATTLNSNSLSNALSYLNSASSLESAATGNLSNTISGTGTSTSTTSSGDSVNSSLLSLLSAYYSS
jgi:hypothetical protein